MIKKLSQFNYSFILIIIVIAIMLFTNAISSHPQYAITPDQIELEYIPDLNSPQDLSFQAQAAVLYDLDHNTIVASKEADVNLAPASLTKLFTTFIAAKTLSPDKMITIDNDYSNLPEHKLGLVIGDEISVSDLIKSSLLSSNNDSAEQLANMVGVDNMNQTISDLGLKSHFANGSGLDAQQHFSNARDIAILASAIFNEDKMMNIMSQKTANIKLNNKDINVTHTHHMIGAEKPERWVVLAGKTGTTANAGECLLTIAKVKQKQQWHHIAIILLSSPDRYQETENILDKIST